MINMRYIVLSSAALAFMGCVATIVFVGNMAVTNDLLIGGRKNLSVLESQYDQLHERYFSFVFEHLGSRAQAEGFVALSGVRYITPSTVVGLASSQLPE